MKTGNALLAAGASIVGGGVFGSVCSPSALSASPLTLSPTPELWWPAKTMAFGEVFGPHCCPSMLQTNPFLRSPLLFQRSGATTLLSVLRSSFSIRRRSPQFVRLCWFLADLLCSAAKVVVVSGEQEESMMMFWMGGARFVWFGRSLGVMETAMLMRKAGLLGFSPELVPVVYCSCISTGVSSSFCFLIVIWATGVGSGWCMSLYVSTGVGSGLLVGLSQCFVAGIVEHHGRSLELGLSPTPKGVRLIVPSGILKSLTVLVSWPANGGSFVHDCTSVLLWRRNNPCWAPNHDVFILVVYVSTVSVVVFLTLITFHPIV